MEGDNPFRMKIPYILVTNGGGMSEELRCQKLSKMFDFEIKPSQYIQAHTILKSVAHKYADSPVLVVGGKYDVLRKVAEEYGFRRAYTTLDVHAWNPSVWPFHSLSPEERNSTKEVDFSRTPISAIFVFHDPRNWSLDIQIMCDVLQSGGIIGGPRHADGNGKPIELIFCNPDLLWKSDFDIPRLGQGAFKTSFLAVYKALTGSTYPYVQYGKPTAETYKFAERVLTDRFQELWGVKHLPSV
jgi:HAD superfamily hydrolase (TIGR01456 family)